MNYRVVILCAGKGSRLGRRTTHLNKALLKVGDKAVISHTIDSFPKETEFVIALGYQGNTVRQYLEIVYPERKFIFVEVDKLEGVGSGPGYSLMCCKKELQCPFYFITCDTIVDIKNRLHWQDDWAGWADIDDYEKENYCTLELDSDGWGNSYVEGYCDKSENGTNNAFIGVAFIKSYEYFWKHLEQIKSSINEEIQVAPSILSIPNINAWCFDWYDTGSEEGLQNARKHFGGLQNLDKEDEEIYFVNGHTIKYFRDENVIKDRICRSNYLGNVIPKILSLTQNFYKYEFLKGKDLFAIDNQYEIIETLLKFYKDNLWRDIFLGDIERSLFKNVCLDFYRGKTLSRLEKFFENSNIIDREDIINGKLIPKIENIFKLIDWDWLCDGVPSNFHGDLHFSNTLLLDDGNFKLLDWRQNFGNILQYGDRYYDLAKFYHQFLWPHTSVKSEKFSILERDGLIECRIEIPENIEKSKEMYEKWIINEGYDLKKIKVLTGLIFLSMSPLHEKPLDKFLFYFAKHWLYNLFNV